MFRNYIITAFRNILRSKVFTLVNIIGLALGIACTLVIIMWIQDELSYDKYHEKGDRVMHAYLRVYDQGRSLNSQSTTSHELASALIEEIPEIVNVARIGRIGEVGLNYGDKLFLESQGIAADPEIFDLFTIIVIEGNPQTALLKPNALVITQKMAVKYFGEENPVGKSIRLNNKIDLEITAIVQDPPEHTHQKYDFMVPFSLLGELGFDIELHGNYFGNCVFNTYALLDQGVSRDEVSGKVTERFNFSSDNIGGEVFLVPLPKTHRFFLVGSNLLIYIFIIIAVLILLIACINFVNLSTARSITRTREVGIRKIFGAHKGDLVFQFLGETLIFTLIALNFAIILIRFFLPSLNRLSGKHLNLNYLDPNIILLLVLVWLVTSFLSGIYPAFFLSSFKPVRILQMHGQTGSGKSGIRKTLVVIQFMAAVFFLICTTVVSRQFYYMDTTDLGYNKKDLIYIRLRDETSRKSDIIKSSLEEIPAVLQVSNTSHLPILVAGGYYQEWGRPEYELRYLCETQVDYDYLDALGLRMAGGRYFSEKFTSDSVDNIILNETAVRQMGWQNAVGETFYYQGEYYNVVGVMNDFHHVPLSMEISPLLFRLKPAGNSYLLVKIKSGSKEEMRKTAGKIEEIWKQTFPEYPLEYNFLEDYKFEQEKTAEAAQKLMKYFTFLAVIISCLGLYGLSNFMAERRVKEIGIRKILGSTVTGIILKLSKEYLTLLLYANIIAWIIAFLVMKKFLEVFAYRINLGAGFFVVAAFAVSFLALLTVGYQAVKSASQNPAETLRYE